jgi:hypothetical protein
MSMIGSPAADASAEGATEAGLDGAADAGADDGSGGEGDPSVAGLQAAMTASRSTSTRRRMGGILGRVTAA